MAEPSPNGNGGNDLLLFAAFTLAADPTACEALAAGEAVPRHRLNPYALEAIGEPLGGPDVVLTPELARSVELRVPHATRQAQEPPAPPVAESAAPTPVTVETPPRPKLYFMRGDEFLDQPLANITPLVGTIDDALFMPGSLLLLAGTGGAGKTTLEIHALLHFACGAAWFGIPTTRPLRILVVENEGPHDPFVRKVSEMARRWHHCPCGCGAGDGGAALRENVFFLDSPWAHFSWDDPEYAGQLREFVVDNGVDIVMANPLGRLGMKGAGTPEETRAFLDLLIAGGLGRDFGAWVNHHLVKYRPNVPIVDQLSGDWVPHADTILVLQQDGLARGKMTFGKVRWGDQARPPMLLEWLKDPDGPVGYRPHDVPVDGVSDDQLYEKIDEFLARIVVPVSKTKVRETVVGDKTRISDLLDEGAKAGRYLRTGSPARGLYTLVSAAPTTSTPPGELTLPWQ